MARRSAAYILCKAGLAGAVWLLAAFGAPDGPPAPNPYALGPPVVTGPFSVLLVTVDTWRWDYIGVSGAGRVQTPNLDRLAREGIYEREAVTPCPLTTPAHASIMTGADLVRHRVWDCTMYSLREGVPTLAEAFRSAGFTTAAFVASETLGRRYGLDRGFGIYDDAAVRGGKSGDWWTASRDGAEVTKAFLAFLRAQPAQAKLFAWVHYYDAHLPYRPRPELDGRYPKDRYAAQVAFIDGEVGKLVSAFGGSGRAWRVVVVGDHGEGLGDRGEITHGIGLYRSTLHVPMILYPRPERPLLHVKPWGLVDLKPTIVEWCGLASAGGADGESLFAGGGKERALYAATLLPTLFFGADPSLGVRQGEKLYLRNSSEELFNLEADPGEMRNISAAPEAAGGLKALQGLCDREWPAGWSAAALPSVLGPTTEEMQNLRSLGYLGGGPAAAKVQSAPIGQLMKDHSDWEVARMEAQASGRNDRLLDLLQRLAGKYPNAFALHKDCGTYLAKAGRIREAIQQFEAAARLFAGDSVVLGNLGSLYLDEGRVEAARVVLERSVEIDPGSAGPQKNLGIIYAEHLNQPDKAILHFTKYLEAGGDAESDKIRAYIRSAGQHRTPGPR